MNRLKWKSMANPVDWFAWIYGKWFNGHPWLGYFTLLGIGVLVLGLVWIRAIDKYNEQHPQPQVASSATAPPISTQTVSPPIQSQSPNKSSPPNPQSQQQPDILTPSAMNKPKPPDTKNERVASQKTINVQPGAVASFGQKGGVTAGEIHNLNIGLVPRQIPPGASVQPLLSFSGVRAYIHWRADDNETIIFKDSLCNYLTTAQWQLRQSAGHVGDESMQNVVVDVNASLNDNDKAVLAANALANFLSQLGIKCSIDRRPDNHLSNDEMYLRIGPIR
jgi:hypothetical protein